MSRPEPDAEALETSPLTPAQVLSSWELLLPVIDRGLSFDSPWSPDILKTLLVADHMKVWPANGNGIVLTHIQDVWDGRRVCWIDLCGGNDAEEWVPDILKSIENHARSERCTEVRASGRMGWHKRFLSHYQVHSVNYRRVLWEA